MNRILLAVTSFFSILFRGTLSDAAMTKLGLSRRPATAKAAAPAPPAQAKASDGALQLLSILQRDARLVDFLMEDISGYSDEQVGAAVRGLHDQGRESLARCVSLVPVIDGVEGTYTKAPAAAARFIGNVPAGTPSGGILRHKGWRAANVDLPALSPKQDATIVAPAEIEIE